MSAFRAVIGLFCMGACPVIWIITESTLSMYRFPPGARRAAWLVAGFHVQLGVLWYAGESITFAMFVSVYTNLLAAFVCLAQLYARVRRQGFPHAAVAPLRKHMLPAAIAAGVLTIAPPVALFPHLRAGFARMDGLAMLLAIIVTVVNTIMTIRELVDLSAFGRPDPQEQRYAAEWEKWAAPTVILLILSVAAGVVIAGATR